MARKKTSSGAAGGANKQLIARALQHQRVGQLGEAEQIYRQLLDQNPRDPQASHLLGVLYYSANKLPEARHWLHRAVDLKPRFHQAWTDLGNTLRDQGEIDAAIDAYQRAIKAQSDYALAHCFLAQLRDHSEPDQWPQEVEQMEQAYARSRPQSLERRDLAWGLARAQEQLGQHQRAFDLLLEAHAAGSGGADFDLDATRDYFQRIRSAFTPRLLKRLQDRGSNSETPVFVLGLPRSGSSLVEQILASHSQVFGAGELRLVGNLCGQLEMRSQLSFGEAFAQLDERDVDNLAQAYERGATPLAPTAKRIVDKMPSNFLALGMLAVLFPNARFVHCERDALATCWSIFATRFAEPHHFANSLSDLGGYYQLYREHMAYWEDLLPGRIHTVNYEALVADPEPVIRELLAYCDLAFEPACLEPHTTERTVRTASASQVREPIHERALERHQPFAEHLQPLIDALGDCA
jgi:tetratricopeptide (TPR) repeat protein